MNNLKEIIEHEIKQAVGAYGTSFPPEFVNSLEEEILKHYIPISEATFIGTKYKNNKVKVSWYDNNGNKLIPISEVEEYLRKLEEWVAPNEFGRASGGVTKDMILKDLKELFKATQKDNNGQ